MKVFYDEIETPVGKLVLLVNENNQLIRLDFGSWDEVSERLRKWISTKIQEAVIIHDPHALQAIKLELENFFAGKLHLFSIDCEFYGTDFQKKVWHALCQIPFAETRTYKDIATLLGNPKAVRAVGGAVNKNPISIVVPCHRVIGSSGKLVGYNGGIDKKEFLLQHESSSSLG